MAAASTGMDMSSERKRTLPSQYTAPQAEGWNE
jgi:hypothetical protein